jgi:hypothetical protein
MGKGVQVIESVRDIGKSGSSSTAPPGTSSKPVTRASRCSARAFFDPAKHS